MKQKGFAPIIILLIILVLFGIVGGMVYFKGKTNQLKSLEPQVSPVPSTSQSNQTADWKKYNNETLMLSFQYPKDWVVKTAMFSGDPEEIRYPVLDIDSDQGLIASLSYFDNPDNLPLFALEEKRKKKELYGMVPAIYLSSDQAIKIGEISGYYRKDTLCEPVMCDIYVWSNKGKVFVLMNFKDPMNGQGQLFNNLLSTFRFTDTSTISSSVLNISQEQAIAKVKNLSEVKDYLARVPSGNVEFDHEDEAANAWVIHVYEVKNGHTATFNWYSVNKETGKITDNFGQEY